MHKRLIFELADGWRDLAFESFRDGVEVHGNFFGFDSEPSVALLKYVSRTSRAIGHAGLVFCGPSRACENNWR